MTASLVEPALDRDRLAADLATTGLTSGRDLLVHASMSRVGHVTGGPSTLLDAIRDVLGPEATVVVPTQTPYNSISSTAYREATRGLSPAELVAYEERIEGFDPATSPSFRMGALSECVRRQPGAARSAHPQASFAAIGPHAAEFMAVHDMACHLGERSPLAALYAAGADMLLVGVGYESCTALHLAEYRLPWPPPMSAYRCFTKQDGQRVQHDFTAPYVDAGSFPTLGRDFDTRPCVRSGRVGSALSRVAPMRQAVDFAVQWMIAQSMVGAPTDA